MWWGYFYLLVDCQRVVRESGWRDGLFYLNLAPGKKEKMGEKRKEGRRGKREKGGEKRGKRRKRRRGRKEKIKILSVYI